RFSLEGNSFAELARRNTSIGVDGGGTMGKMFQFADFIFGPNSAPGVLDPKTGAELLQLADGSKQFFDPLHQGKNVLFNGGPGDDRFVGDVGDDTMWGNDGNDRMDGGEGDDRIFGGAGDDIIFGGNGNDDLRGGPGNDAISSGPGFGGDIVIGVLRRPWRRRHRRRSDAQRRHLRRPRRRLDLRWRRPRRRHLR
ncbi:MAG: hypothetical protein E6J85_11255, partial [Deltaproteobacteria bacterium]